jgi:hypothetical protein
MVTGLVSCVAHGLQLSQQFKVCGFLAIVSASDCPSVNLKPSHNQVLGVFTNLLRRLVNPLGVIVYALL